MVLLVKIVSFYGSLIFNLSTTKANISVNVCFHTVCGHKRALNVGRVCCRQCRVGWNALMLVIQYIMLGLCGFSSLCLSLDLQWPQKEVRGSKSAVAQWLLKVRGL